MPYLTCDGVNPPVYQTVGFMVQIKGRYNKWVDCGLYCSQEAAELSPAFVNAKPENRRVIKMENL